MCCAIAKVSLRLLLVEPFRVNSRTFLTRAGATMFALDLLVIYYEITRV